MQHNAFFYNLGLLVHMIGLFFVAGGALGAIVAERLLWQRLQHRVPGPATAVLPLLRQFPLVIQVGSILMPLSGLLMLQQVNWSYWGQFWLMGKLVLYVLLVLNGALVAKPLGQRLAQTLLQPPVVTGGAGLKDDDASLSAPLARLRRQLFWFTLSQMGFLFMLFVLSTFKPV